MSEPGDDLRAIYQAALAAYLDTGGEQQLEAAFSVGRQAMAARMPLLSLVNLHREAVASLQTEQARGLGPVDTTATYQFLVEALATFEMTQRGYSEAQERARWEREQSLMLQRNLLPVATPEADGLDVAVRYLAGEPGSHAGGDWYDVIALDGDHVALVVGDVSGHGVSAAAAMGQLRIAVLAYAVAGYQPASVVAKVDHLLEQLGTGDIATLVYVVVNPHDHRLTVVNAGHPPPLLIQPDGSTRLLREGHARLLGVQPALLQREQRVLNLEQDSRLLLFTDGLIEPLERQGEDGLEHLALVTEGFDGSAGELCDHVLAELTPDGAHDDICVVAATVTA
jgi:serine phosphatase RsbU (regulator of sigma subunit)